VYGEPLQGELLHISLEISLALQALADFPSATPIALSCDKASTPSMVLSTFSGEVKDFLSKMEPWVPALSPELLLKGPGWAYLGQPTWLHLLGRDLQVWALVMALGGSVFMFLSF
jgi:hypothetical protein